MGKTRVYKLATELGISNKELISELVSLGYPVKNRMSTVDIDEVFKIRETIIAKLKEAEKKDIKPKPATQISETVAVEPKPHPDKAVETETVLKETTAETEEALEVIEIRENITLKEFAEKTKCTPNELMKSLIKKGVMATINSPIDERIAKVSEHIFKKSFKFIPLEADEIFDDILEEEENADDYVPRPPVVTIMGHVDHGKTTLLDAIRESKITEKEAGGITQHIGAYEISHEKGPVVFLDTPGHEAFTAMRARGAQVTDIVILVVAADDGLMPQTIEAIHHARAGNVPIVVAINKIDKPNVNIEKIKKDLTEHDLAPEEWGGQTIFAEVSAKNKIGLDNLMEMILLQTEIMELKGNPKVKGRGTIIESKLDKRRGAVATLIVQKGVLKNGDSFVAGSTYGKIRALLNDKGTKIKNAEISSPVEIIGLSSVPAAGDSFIVVNNEKEARHIATARQQKLKETFLKRSVTRITLEDLRNQIDEGKIEELNVVIKADVDGSVQAISDSLLKIGSDEVRIKIIHSSVGGVTESDVLLAEASNAVIIGFHVRPTEQAATLAGNEKVEMKLYSVIYDVINDFKAALEGLLKPRLVEKRLGRVEVRQVISIPRAGVVCGSYVLDGNIKRNSDARLVRDSVVIYEGKIASLRRFKDDVKEVQSGFECGVVLENFQDIKQGDIIETYYFEEIARKL
ncbi:MAG TPA: translation initiation factor IF-2 [Nitrospinota bacterium]|jgi:translation initiation factor IF-2|nr:translation initiation factor IF-2 [Nitrospinota bacterium]HJN03238.1 translation initiation factor IF-2 [Nitrospinota bacterium]